MSQAVSHALGGADGFGPLRKLVLDAVSSPLTRVMYARALDDFFRPVDRTGRPPFTRATVQAWRVTLVDMRERGAQLSDQELEQLVEWLARVWGTNEDK